MSSRASLARADLARKAEAYVDQLCLPHPDRHVGGAGNSEANELFARSVSSLGYVVRETEFPCVVWEPGPSAIEVAGISFGIHTGPYSLPVDSTAPLTAAGSIEELEKLDAPGSILLLHGELVSEQLTPKNYPFYRWESHSRIIGALEAARPVAVIAATGRSSELVGSLYPFPLIEDADFDIPHAFMTDTEGAGLLRRTGQLATLSIVSGRRQSVARQLVAASGAADRRIVVSGHIDSRRGSPGAIDNASGVVVLLLVAELLAEFEGSPGFELVPFNGEDDYAAPGELVYLGEYGDRLSDVVTLNVNVDGVGWRDHDAEVSFYECPDEIAETARHVLKDRAGLVEGSAWPQSDHMIFAMRKIPAIALTTADATGFRGEIAHTAADVPSEANPVVLAAVAEYVADLVRALSSQGEAS